MKLLARDIVAGRLGWLLRALSFFNTGRQITHIVTGGHLAYLQNLWETNPKVIASGNWWPRHSALASLTIPASSIDNLYRPERNPALGYERSRLVLADVEGVIPRFRELAVQEWWNLVAPSGFLMIRLTSPRFPFCTVVPSVERVIQLCRNGVLRFRKLLYYGQGELVLLEKVSTVELGRIDQWTFGIVTNGKRPDWLQEAIASIRSQGVPDYEILVVGPRQHLLIDGEDLRVIDFTEKDELGWISRKKNLIAESARYENLAIMHDRIVLGRDWYEGMRAYGNYFWLLGVPVESSNGKGRNVDWVRYKGQRGARRLAEIELLDYEDWDPFVFVNGGILIAKRSCWIQIRLDERLFWQQNEDVWFSRAFIAEGWLPRMNPYARAWSKTFYPTRIALRLRPDGRRQRVATAWSQFSRDNSK